MTTLCVVQSMYYLCSKQTFKIMDPIRQMSGHSTDKENTSLIWTALVNLLGFLSWTIQ